MAELALRDRFAADGARRAGPTLGRWLSPERLTAGADQFLTPLWERFEAPALAASFAEARPVAGATAEDYGTRVLETPAGPVLAGIRFKGGDLAQPFVEVATSFGMTPDALEGVRRVVAPAFAVFAPPRMRLWRFADEAPVPGAEPDQLLYAAPIAELRTRPLPAHFGEVVLGPAFDLGRLGDLEAAYAALVAADPVLGAEVGPASAGELQACLDEGLLFDAHIDWDWAGMVAGRSEPFFGAEGVLMVEELLVAEHRGRGLGACLQRHFIERLMPAGGAILHGTIHASNLASRRTAEHCGRTAIMIAEFVPLA